jgi:hypothetical protein
VQAALVVASEALGAAVVASEEAVAEECERGFGSPARCGSAIDGSGPRRPGGGETGASASPAGAFLGRQVFSGVSGARSAAPRAAGANFSATGPPRLGVTCTRGAESGGGKAESPVAGGERGSESSDGNVKDPGKTFGPAYAGDRVVFDAGLGFASSASRVGFSTAAETLGVSVGVALGVSVVVVVIGAGLNPGFFSDGDSQDSMARAMADGLVTFLHG